MRGLAGAVLGIGACLVVWSVARTFPQLIVLGVGVVLVFAGGGVLLAESDVLGDPPAEEEERRRRGQAGWQKPVAPPLQGGRPGGLPPRKR